mmetsp:Transcript_23860/g.68633  ORF Transcript_23860/g.68633 Transcript_23860/m.68633 type:complete len:168 (-) Transcript_23860:174-677(-)
MMRSAEHPSVPEVKGFVRAETLVSGYVIRPLDGSPDSTSLFILAQTDIKGLIPKALVNATAARAPVMWTDNLRKACEKHIKEHGKQVPEGELVTITSPPAGKRVLTVSGSSSSCSGQMAAAAAGSARNASAGGGAAGVGGVGGGGGGSLHASKHSYGPPLVAARAGA